MSLTIEQFKTIINGVRSICDELLQTPDPAIKTAPPAPAPGAAPTSMPGAAAPGTAPPAPKTGADPVITGAGAPDPVTLKQDVGYVGPEGSVELDPEGLPWDARIHTAKKSKLKSGVWRIKPGSDAKMVAQVKTELAQKVADYQAGVTPEKIADTVAEGETITQGAAEPGAADPEGLTWSALLNKIVAAQITGDVVVDACVACGVPNFAALQGQEQSKLDAVAMVLGLS